MKYVISILSFAILLVYHSCQPASTVRSKDRSDSVLLLQKALRYCIEDSNLTDVIRTRTNAGRYRIYSDDKNIYNLITGMTNDTLVSVRKEDICKLGIRENFIEVSDLDIQADTSWIRIYSRCVYSRNDTCIVGGMMCGGGIFFKFARKEKSWQIHETLGFSD